MEVRLGVRVGTSLVVLYNLEAGVKELQALEDVCRAHLAQVITLYLYIVTRKAILASAADTGNHHIGKLYARLELDDKVMLALDNLL